MLVISPGPVNFVTATESNIHHFSYYNGWYMFKETVKSAIYGRYTMKNGFQFYINNPGKYIVSHERSCFVGKLKFTNDQTYPTVSIEKIYRIKEFE